MKSLNKLKIFLIIFAITIVLSCNNSDWILYRAGNDYFPLQKGYWWQYESNGVYETVEVKGDTVAYGRPCIHLLRDFDDEFWIKDNDEIRKLEFRTKNYDGTEYPIQQAWLLQYRLPFILGNYWTESFTDTVLVLGDTYRINQTITRKITDITDLSVVAGMFIQTYKVEYYETITINDSIEYYSGYEWFAPNVGLVKKIINNVEKILVDYSY